MLKGEVTAGQAAAVWGFTTVGSGVYARAFGALRAAHHEAGLRFHWEKQPADNVRIGSPEADDAQTR